MLEPGAAVRSIHLRTDPRDPANTAHTPGWLVAAQRTARRFAPPRTTPHIKTRGQARRTVFEYLEGFYDPGRRRSALGYLPPAEYEQTQTHRSR